MRKRVNLLISVIFSVILLAGCGPKVKPSISVQAKTDEAKSQTKGGKEIKTDFQKRPKDETAKLASRSKKPEPYEVDPSYYKDSADEKIKADLKKSWFSTKSPGYILDSYDKQCFENGEEDRRVLMVLEALTQDSRHILAVRVKSSYPRYDSLSRESDPGWTNISAHSTAQAFDIFYIDDVEICWQASNDGEKQKKAQRKIHEIIGEILAIGRQERNLLPTQICVYSRDDILAFSQEAQTLYGGYPPQTGLRGMMAGDRYWDRIHIGY